MSLSLALPPCSRPLRSHQIFDIFTSAWGAAARAVHLEYVVGTWGYVCNGGSGCGPQATQATLSFALNGTTLAAKSRPGGGDWLLHL